MGRPSFSISVVLPRSHALAAAANAAAPPPMMIRSYLSTLPSNNFRSVSDAFHACLNIFNGRDVRIVLDCHGLVLGVAIHALDSVDAAYSHAYGGDSAIAVDSGRLQSDLLHLLFPRSFVVLPSGMTAAAY